MSPLFYKWHHPYVCAYILKTKTTENHFKNYLFHAHASKKTNCHQTYLSEHKLWAFSQIKYINSWRNLNLDYPDHSCRNIILIFHYFIACVFSTQLLQFLTFSWNCMKCASLLYTIGKDNAGFIPELSERSISLSVYFHPGPDNFQQNLV